ncbi:DUF4198 domain-containing protein [Pedomonas mirosovicensis]|uniref:DUF4198 domain-containing protein n=1 Tax=Pedomonas mirosovicensis TaxID=2908641 RepID=UPI00216A03F3|nr:DUF4198 domain-containing protein [Pedomonas mirosovicensis]MCH8686326.1 DUF4198 domain-containing protein [Pedomonas mirosovicensis]
MSIRFKHLATGLAAIAALSMVSVAASAHRAWLLPSATTVSGTDMWVSVDAAISNNLFNADHFPMQLGGIQVTAPDGAAVQPQNGSTGRYRSVFDVKLDQTGTYKIANAGHSVMASYQQNGERKRLRGPVERLKDLPQDATDVKVSEIISRNETFVTNGNLTTTVFKLTGKGLELEPVTHPNDLVEGEPATFRFLLDGKPAANLKVTAVPGGTRYRNQPVEITATTNANGEVALTFPQPGMYWLDAEVADDKASVPQASRRVARYNMTVEVMPM